ncbi:UDP-N-acetylmuramoyl-L-alanyl-D-glutamate--2,6-diaminopimelate ligase [Devosia sp. 66-22]|uniref:UDP-N-acetylmuramoyl-L-alanyl-D-glutamate--2, 6-diaminopimelate ligase n=1 Tax=Devosia sp. 66-22 TaxID=1895753 RepID=UPI000928CB85|nr:UDP-N-acetylmuramoyl-L-alanyl-D-glutamate--2,6-diaminopimelate ligase [Devosia sp. 66-22]OJX50644.1 MAG: UDP-N-acetylmuramoyl-L-alanyl-D-glutamate--2,6-diaminopimelate ligase [Devosia sp. 66-22]
MSFALAELLEGAGAALPRLKVEGVNADSRAIRPGEVFFAIPGLKTHGDAFAAQARANGAKAMVSNRRPSADPGIPVIVVDDVRAAYARAAATQYAPPPETIVGVTGTNGKSSIVSFVRQIWSACGLSAASVGTVGIETASGLIPGELTTPDALSLHRDLGNLRARGIDHVAMEASSQGLDQRRVDGVRFSAVAFTNLSRDHLDYHADMAEYRDAKVRLFTDLIAEGGAAVVNVDDPEHEAFMFAALASGATLMTVGREGAWFEIESIVREGYGQRVKGRLVGEPEEFHLPLTGAFQASNAVVALGLAMATGASKKGAIESLGKLKGARGRLELVAEHNGAAIFVDYAHKPVALETALTALRPYASNQLRVVFGAGGDRDTGKRPMMGEIAGRLADKAIVTDDNPRTENAASIRAEIVAAVPGADEIGDRRKAIEHAVRSLEPGDVLLIAGKGHEDYQIVGTTKHHFSDHEVVAETLKDL